MYGALSPKQVSFTLWLQFLLSGDMRFQGHLEPNYDVKRTKSSFHYVVAVIELLSNAEAMGTSALCYCRYIDAKEWAINLWACYCALFGL